jgi:hypothetical protein
VGRNPHWLGEQLAGIAEVLAKTQRYVYASRDKGFELGEPPGARTSRI